MSETLISTHTFMLPMRWDYLPKGYNIIKGKQDYNFDERTDMQTFCNLMQNSNWKRRFYALDNDVKRYNEMTYFQHKKLIFLSLS